MQNFNCSLTLKYRQIKKFLALGLSDVVFIMLINVKMPRVVGILAFISWINFMLSGVEYNLWASSLFLSETIAKLGRTVSILHYKTRTKHQTPTNIGSND